MPSPTPSPANSGSPAPTAEIRVYSRFVLQMQTLVSRERRPASRPRGRFRHTRGRLVADRESAGRGRRLRSALAQRGYRVLDEPAVREHARVEQPLGRVLPFGRESPRPDGRGDHVLLVHVGVGHPGRPALGELAEAGPGEQLVALGRGRVPRISAAVCASVASAHDRAAAVEVVRATRPMLRNRPTGPGDPSPPVPAWSRAILTA